ncbi:MAG: hypothetical protein E6Q27_09340 [Aeromicrobium sp.]|jgi:hypothetical protein|nr:MAG: hypothetical protein E6Q27_09340 [Aeromicrobium sp.]
MTIPGHLLEEIRDLPDEDHDALVRELVIRRDRDKSLTANQAAKAWDSEVLKRVEDIATGRADLVSIEHFKRTGQRILDSYHP